MSVVTVTFDIEADHATSFAAAMRTQARNSLELEPDCLRFDVCREPANPRADLGSVPGENPSRVFLYEIYSDAAAFQRHLESAHFKDFDATVAPWIRDKAVQTWLLDEPSD